MKFINGQNYQNLSTQPKIKLINKKKVLRRKIKQLLHCTTPEGTIRVLMDIS